MLQVNSKMTCLSVKIAPPSNVSLSDPYWSNVSLLLKGDGGPTLDGNSIQPIDSGPSGYVITKVGSPVQRNVSPFSSGGSMYSVGGGVDAYLTAPNAAGLFGSSNFTIECFVRFSTNSVGYQFIMSMGGSADMQGWLLYLEVNNTLQFLCSTNGTSWTTAVGSGGFVPVVNTWYHMAVVRNGTVVTLYVDGTSIGSTSIGAGASLYPATGTVRLGHYPNVAAGSKFNGYITNMRIVKSAVYTSNFTRPSSPVQSIANTTLLLKFDGIQSANNATYVDSSNSRLPITQVGNVIQGTQSPFSTGGSVYMLDAQSDMLAFNANAGSIFSFTGNFTIEGWIKIPSGGDRSMFVLSNGTTYLAMNMSYSAQAVNIYINAGLTATYNTTLTANTWYHFALVRNGSGAGNIKTYLNGVSLGSITNTGTLGYVNPTIARIGGGAVGCPQYVSNVRVVTSAVYTSNFTVPTSELTPITGTVLLVSCNNWHIGDSSKKFNLYTSGNPKINQSIVKYGTGSVQFDGSSRLYTPSDSAFAFGSGNFTLETWIYVTAYPSGTEGRIFQFASDDHDNFELWPDGKLMYYDGSLHYSTNTVPLNQWNHVAFVRNGTTGTFFINGVANGSFSTTYTSGNRSCNVGWNSAQSVGNALVGYLDDARITKGIARYTANFTPPIQTFPTQ